MPAVSTISKQSSNQLVVTAIGSVVVPDSALVITLFSPKMLFNNVDFHTLGLPIIANLIKEFLSPCNLEALFSKKGVFVLYLLFSTPKVSSLSS